jgi:hypothetical protein
MKTEPEVSSKMNSPLKLGMLNAVSIALATIVLMSFIREYVQTTPIRLLLASGIAGALTAVILIVKWCRRKRESRHNVVI